MFFCHDGEHSMGVNGSQNINRVGPHDTGSQGSFNKSNPQFFHQDLAKTDEYKMLFADHVYRHYFNDGLLTPGQVAARVEQRRAIVDKVIIAESARWGDSKRSSPFDREDWEAEVNRLFSYIERRTDTVFNQIKSAKLYPDTTPPEFNRRGGVVDPGFVVQLVNESGDIYYTADGSDPRMIGGAVNPAAVRLSGSTENVTLFEAASTWRYLDDNSISSDAWKAAAYDDSSWAVGDGEFGYGDGDETTVVGFGDQSSSKYITTWFRKTFAVTRADAFLSLTLSVRRDDGIVVYINGVEVARDNLPAGVIEPDTLALSSLSSSDERDFLELTVDPLVFVEGENVIAVEIHQAGAGNSDISFDAMLTGVRATESDAPITLNASTHIRTRSLASGEWSALNEATFFVGTPASADNLVVSEINYHPADPTAAEIASGLASDDGDFEFLELRNISGGTIDLSGVRFTRGISFTFPLGTTLSANDYVVIVRNEAAFQLRYPTVPTSKIAGIFANGSGLDNGGETIAIAPPETITGTLIREFAYNDAAPWPESADGQGYTLQLRSPMSNPDHSLPENWRASSTIGGTPGASDDGGGGDNGYSAWATANSVVGGPTGDDDGDGVSNFLEFALLAPPHAPSQSFLPTGTVVDGFFTFSFRRNPAATSVNYTVESSPDLQAWLAATSQPTVELQMELASATANGDGSETVTWRSVRPVAEAVGFYVRLGVQE
ncbi:MAG: lamin tail domain-containing protein [Verrucomicrobiae bacterium]|nr:lamin tail domain-containing protein [Verrucomicrobiae bacterium]